MTDVFLKYLPVILCFAVFCGTLFIIIFKPDWLEQMPVNWSAGPFSGKLTKGMSRFCCICFGLLWAIIGFGVALNNCGVISSKSVLNFFIAGFVTTGIGIFYDILRKG